MPAKNLTTIKTRDGKTHTSSQHNISIIRDPFGDMIEAYNGSPIHSESGPAIIYPDGESHYYCDGKILNAEEYADRLKINPHYYYSKGVVTRTWVDRAKNVLHRLHGPAIEVSDGSYYVWYKDGLIHRDDGPAMTLVAQSGQGTQELYFTNGEPHSKDGLKIINRAISSKNHIANDVDNKKLGSMLKKKIGRRTSIIARKGYDVYLNSQSPLMYDLINDKLNHSAKVASKSKHPYERRALALAMYTALVGGPTPSLHEYAASNSDFDAGLSQIYVFKSDQKIDPYLLYQAMYFILTCESSSIMTCLADDSNMLAIIDLAMDDWTHADEARSRSEFTKDFREKIEPIKKEESSGVASWVLPLAIAAGLSLFTSKRKSAEVKEAKEVSCNMMK
jgi:hypothetical protein